MITTFQDLPTFRERYRESRLVYTGGTFDLLHPGHVEHLEFCKALGDVLFVGVVPDLRVRFRKGERRPIQPQEDRVRLVHALKMVDVAFVQPLKNRGAETPFTEVLTALRPDIFAEFEYAGQWQEQNELLQEIGTTLAIQQGARIGATTALIDRVAQG